MQLKGKKILITGAGSGIGQALAIALAHLGNELVLSGRNLDKLKHTQDMCQNSNILCFATDIQNPLEREQLVQHVSQTFGSLDILINNAGIVNVGKLDETPTASIETMITTNLLAPIMLTRSLLPLLRTSKEAGIINMGSMFGDIAFPYFGVYSATKFGLRGFSDGIRRELARDNIKVFYAAPRATQTPASKEYDDLVDPFDMAIDTPENVAAHIIKSIEKGKTSIYPPTKEMFFLFIQRLFPKLIDKNLQSKVR